MNSLDVQVGNTYKFTYVANDKIVWKIAKVESVSNKWIGTNKWYGPSETILMIEEWV